MKNISFDNPYWLLLAIPLLLLIFIPFFISVNRDNRSRGWIASLVIHAMIAVAVTVSAAGLVYTTVMTRTKIYVVVDTSYSMQENLDAVDGYIAQLSEALPPNARLGVVCFGKDSVIHTYSGQEITSVKNATVDQSGTDIAAALDYTATLFAENELKRIVLVTDGCDTTSEGSIVSSVERLRSKKIKIDTLYVDSNLREGDVEVQLSDAKYTPSTYLNHESKLTLLAESNTDTDAIIELLGRKDGEEEYVSIYTSVLPLESGLNSVEFTLPTDEEGVFCYKAVISATEDTSPHNNVYTLTQSVVGLRRVLLVTGMPSDVQRICELYKDDAEIESYLIGRGGADVPYTVEELSRYDEIVLSNVDIREINNVGAFVDSVDAVVSKYGKSLVTLGDLSMQNKDDAIFARLEELLPVSFGNANKDERLYTLILDVSRSMNDTSQLIIAKDASIKLLSLLDDSDSVIYVPFAGKVLVEEGWKPMRLGDTVDFAGVSEGTTYREWLYREIQEAEPYQGTLIGAALEQAYSNIKGLSFGESQVMLISDGLSYSHENEDAIQIARRMRDEGITVSTVSVLSNDSMLPAIAEAGGGTYYALNRAEEVAELVFATIADDLTESVIERESDVNVVTFRDGVLDGILSLPAVNGYVNSKAKADATTVLTVDYRKNAQTVTPVPLYAWRAHGNGRVSTFTGSLSNGWLSGWSEEETQIFFSNILTENTPERRVDYPFDLTVTYGGDNTSIEVLPSHLNPRATAFLRVTSPDGSVLERQLAFDLNRYFTTVETPLTGRYRVEIVYSYGTHTFSASDYFDVSYYPEYDAFTVFDITAVHDFMRNAGGVYTDGEIDLSPDKREIATYEYSFRIPLLIFAVVLFVIDVFIRKTRWKDIKGFLKKIGRGRRVR